MLNFFRRRFDELVTGSFLFLVLVLTLLYPVDFATPGGRVFARWVLSSAGALVALLLIAVRFTPRVRPLLRIVLEIGPMVVGVVGYVSLKLLHASAITDWLHISSKDRWMMAADVALFGKTPYLWLTQWGLDSRPFIQVMSFFYGLYPFTPIIVLSWFMYKGNMEQFHLIRRAVLISLYCGYCCYILFPVSGPLSLTTPSAPLWVESTVGYRFLVDNFRYAGDCFPSLHTADPWLMVWLCRGKLSPWLMAVAIVTCTCITLSTVALRLHYGIDDLAGLVWIFPIALLARASLPRKIAPIAVAA
jgi:membrane-associated phospholipid phosphatase